MDQMIIFVADDHYESFPGRNTYEEIAADYPDMKFIENEETDKSSDLFA